MVAATAYHPSLAPTALQRHTPEVGAVCGKVARTDLCGGREVTRVHTATHINASAMRLWRNPSFHPFAWPMMGFAISALARVYRLYPSYKFMPRGCPPWFARGP